MEPPRLVTKHLKNRWGSVTKEGVLNLNVNLLKAPTDVLDYIIVHELCHFTVKEHSHHFWSLVRNIMPVYKDKIAWLESNASLLLE